MMCLKNGQMIAKKNPIWNYIWMFCTKLWCDSEIDINIDFFVKFMHTNQKFTWRSISIVSYYPVWCINQIWQICVQYFQIHELRYLWRFICFIFVWSAKWATAWFFDWKFGHWSLKDLNFWHHQNIVKITYPTHMQTLCAFCRIS